VNRLVRQLHLLLTHDAIGCSWAAATNDDDDGDDMIILWMVN